MVIHIQRLICCGVLSLLSVISLGAESEETMSVAQRRQAILMISERTAESLLILERALADGSPLIRRMALRTLSRIAEDSDRERIERAFREDDDVLVRRMAMEMLVEQSELSVLTVLKEGLQDESDVIRLYAVELLVQQDVEKPEVIALLKQASEDRFVEVRGLAAKALWPFYRDSRSVRDKPEFQDMHLQIRQVIRFSPEGWLFRIDPEANGHEARWYLPDDSDEDWKEIKIEQSWESQGVDYDGVAWYRYRFVLPEKIEMDGVDIVFEGVDESAWVWMNGEYVGEHDIGEDGWNRRFPMGVTEFLKWGEENLLTVRVLDRKMAGGIWKPVYLEVLSR